MAVRTRFGGWLQDVGAWVAGQTTPEKLKADADAVQQRCVEVCGFLPKIESIAAIFAAGFPEFMIATAIANAICAAINAGAAIKVGDIKVSGVFVHGSKKGLKISNGVRLNDPGRL